jgi:hypothetical protein
LEASPLLTQKLQSEFYTRPLTLVCLCRMVYLGSEDLLACVEEYTGTVKVVRRSSHELVQVGALVR